MTILTKSSKNHGFCVAGINKNGEWVRIVSCDAERDGSIASEKLVYSDGTDCEVLDIVDVPVLRNSPTSMQPENVLMDERCRWRKIGRSDISQVIALHPVETQSFIFGDKFPSIILECTKQITYSLTLIQCSNLKIYCKQYSDSVSKPKASFYYNDEYYEGMSVTDPDYYDCDEVTIDRAYVVISLANQPFGGKYYKFVAKIFKDLNYS